MKENNKGFSEIVLILVIVLLVGVVGFFVYQNSQLRQNMNDSTQAVDTNQDVKNTPSEAETASTDTGSVDKPSSDCLKAYKSKYLDLQFDYDNCVWNINENKITPEAGVYSTIIASHNSNHQVTIKAKTMGMGGGYPGCSKVDDVIFLDNDIARAHLPKQTGVFNEIPEHYIYLNSKSDYAVKGHQGEYGDEKFNEYFTFLNPDVFPDTNMCWRGGGINPVAVLQPSEGQTESYQINKDVTVAIEEANISDQKFLNDSNTLAVSIFSSLEK